ncbi:hypothetical protein AKO1_005363, partial [Acrasis kona]
HYKEAYEYISTNNQSYKGIQAVPKLCEFPKWITPNRITIDPMHNLWEGITKQVVESFFRNPKFKSETFYIKKNVWLGEINRKWMNLKLPLHFHRYTRSLEHFTSFKAVELRIFMVYFFPSVILPMIPEEARNMVSFLIEAVQVLIGESITAQQLREAKEKLTKFQVWYMLLAGEDRCTNNIHLLEHLADCVEKFGPLWTSSCFPWEDFNGTLVKCITG